MRVAMTDEDVVRRVGRLFDRAVVRIPRRQEQHRDVFATTVQGASAAALMRSAGPFLGARRRQQVTRALVGWSERPLRRRDDDGRCSADACHRRPGSLGLCRHHYKLWWKARRAGRASRYVPVATPDPFRADHGSDRCDDECDLAWVAGLLEGEGHFGIARPQNGLAYPLIQLKMCDEDVVRRAASLLRAPTPRRALPREIRWKTTFDAKVVGAPAAEWMRRLRPLMGARRGAAIDAALAAYAPIRLVDPPDTCVVPGCSAAHRSRGLCHKHYMSWLRDVARGRIPRVTPLR